MKANVNMGKVVSISDFMVHEAAKHAIKAMTVSTITSGTSSATPPTNTWFGMLNTPLFFKDIVYRELQSITIDEVTPAGTTYDRLVFAPTLQNPEATSTSTDPTKTTYQVVPTPTHAVSRMSQASLARLIRNWNRAAKMGNPFYEFDANDGLVATFGVSALVAALNTAINGSVAGGDIINGWLRHIALGSYGTQVNFDIGAGYSPATADYPNTILPGIQNAIAADATCAPILNRSDFRLYCSIAEYNAMRRAAHGVVNPPLTYDPVSRDLSYLGMKITPMTGWPSGYMIATVQENMIMQYVEGEIKPDKQETDYIAVGRYYNISVPITVAACFRDATVLCFATH